MGNENKKQKQHKNTEERTLEEPKEEVLASPGMRGEVGEASSSKALKRLWHETHFIRRNIGDKYNPRKTEWVRQAGAPSLRQFARSQDKADNQVAKDWFKQKDGLLNEKRSDKNTSRIALERQASKSARRKNSQGSKSKTADTTVKG
jgi:hypothetical protein